MGAATRQFLIACGCLVLVLSVIGCDGDRDCGCSLPHGPVDWLIAVDFGYVPEVIVEYPILVDVTVQVSDFENGGLAPDGLMLALAVTPGNFDNGLAEMETTVTNGRVTVVVMADHPDVYTITVEIPEDGASATFSFSVGV